MIKKVSRQVRKAKCEMWKCEESGEIEFRDKKNLIAFFVRMNYASCFCLFLFLFFSLKAWHIAKPIWSYHKMNNFIDTNWIQIFSQFILTNKKKNTKNGKYKNKQPPWTLIPLIVSDILLSFSITLYAWSIICACLCDSMTSEM